MLRQTFYLPICCLFLFAVNSNCVDACTIVNQSFREEFENAAVVWKVKVIAEYNVTDVDSIEWSRVSPGDKRAYKCVLLKVFKGCEQQTPKFKVLWLATPMSTSLCGSTLPIRATVLVMLSALVDIVYFKPDPTSNDVQARIDVIPPNHFWTTSSFYSVHPPSPQPNGFPAYRFSSSSFQQRFNSLEKTEKRFLNRHINLTCWIIISLAILFSCLRVLSIEFASSVVTNRPSVLDSLCSPSISKPDNCESNVRTTVSTCIKDCTLRISWIRLWMTLYENALFWIYLNVPWYRSRLKSCSRPKRTLRSSVFGTLCKVYVGTLVYRNQTIVVKKITSVRVVTRQCCLSRAICLEFSYFSSEI